MFSASMQWKIIAAQRIFANQAVRRSSHFLSFPGHGQLSTEWKMRQTNGVQDSFESASLQGMSQACCCTVSRLFRVFSHVGCSNNSRTRDVCNDHFSLARPEDFSTVTPDRTLACHSMVPCHMPGRQQTGFLGRRCCWLLFLLDSLVLNATGILACPGHFTDSLLPCSNSLRTFEHLLLLTYRKNINAYSFACRVT